MCNCGAYRANLARRGAKNSGRIEKSGEEEYVLPGRAHRAPADAEELRQPLERMRKIDDIGSLGRDVAGPGHGNADVCRGQSRGIVQAIARHGRLVPLRAKLLQQFHLLRRKQPGFQMRDSQLLGDQLRRPLAVPGKDPLVSQAKCRAARRAPRGFLRAGDRERESLPETLPRRPPALAWRPVRRHR